MGSSVLQNKFGVNIQMVMAHPDDEIIFGWPMLVDRLATSILICSNDADNPDRQWCRHRSEALMELAESLNIPAHSLGYSSEFYKLPTRDEQLKEMMDDVTANLDPNADAIFTHNPWGEYGHLDHIVIHMAVQSIGKPVIFTDIFIPSNWMNLKFAPKTGFSSLCHAVNDLTFYQYCQSFYLKHNVWTWNHPPIEHCNILGSWEQK